MKPSEIPAFPHSFEKTDHPRWVESQVMTLRDYFAAHALMCIDPSNVREYELRAMFGDRGGIMREEIAAKLAYRIADAMLKDRESA